MSPAAGIDMEIPLASSKGRKHGKGVGAGSTDVFTPPNLILTKCLQPEGLIAAKRRKSRKRNRANANC